MTKPYPIPENELLLLISKGDNKAFSALYDTFIYEVFAYIYKHTQCRSETEEISQDVFIKIWERRDRLAHIQSIRNYLLRAAKNRILDKTRREQIYDIVFGMRGLFTETICIPN